MRMETLFFQWASEHRKHFDLAYSYDWDTDNQKVN